MQGPARHNRAENSNKDGGCQCLGALKLCKGGFPQWEETTAIPAVGNCFSLQMGLLAAASLVAICLRAQVCNSWAGAALFWALLGASSAEDMSAGV